jgi:hypothetical protein
MPSFDIVKNIAVSDSYRDKATYDRFDMNDGSLKQVFKGNIEYPDNWNIGLIVGASGTGKSTILHELYSDYIDNYEYDNKSVLDNMPKGISITTIYKTFNSVGFASTPSWLKPYGVLSNGEKMRVDLARAILLNKDIIVFDEFTSVVDRQVAKIGSFATQKTIRRENKKFIAFTCHYDVEEWLMPDFLFSTDEMKLKYNSRRYLQRPSIEIKIYSTNKRDYYWNMFKKYHYLATNIHPAAQCFVLTCNDTIAGFLSYIHFPHSKCKNIKTGHRLVILPDWQGIGLSHYLLHTVAEIACKKGYRFISTTSHPAVCNIYKKSEDWVLTHMGRVVNADKKSIMRKNMAFNRKSTISSNRLTTSWEYIGGR